MKTNIWKQFVVPFAVILMALLVPVSGVSAEAEMEPDWMSNEDLIEKLNEIEDSSDGKVEIGVMGHTSQGNEIPVARVGSGDQVIIINGNIHGNEKSGPEAVISVLETLAGDSSFAQSIRDEITIVTIPRFNMDGAALTQRQNIFAWEEVVAAYPQLDESDPAWYYSARNGGFDVNRDFNPDLNYDVEAEDLPGTSLLPGFFITNEAQSLRDLYLELQAEFGHVEAFVDLHHMGTPVTNKTGEPVTIAIDYPPLGPEDSDKYDDWPLLDQDKSKRYSLAAALGVKEFSDQEETGVSQYIHFPERDYPGQARSAFALNGTATVLFEMPGQQPEYGYDQELIDRVENGLWGILTRMADDSINNLNGDDFLELPQYWTSNVSDTQTVFERFETEGEFENHGVYRSLKAHLMTISRFVEKEEADKVIKHLEGFKSLLDHQEELISEKAYDRLTDDADYLINKWQ